MNLNTLDLQRELYIPDDFHEQLILEHYQTLQKLQAAIEHGNTKEALSLLSHIFSRMQTAYTTKEAEHVRPSDLQKQANSLNAICVISASRFCLNPLYLYTVALHYNALVETITTRPQCHNLMYNMLSDYCSLSSYSGNSTYSDTVQQAIWLISANPAKKLDLPLLADKLGMSQASLSRKFRLETGSTLSQFHTAFCIHNAKRYMQDGNLTLTQIAHRVGFSDASYFSKVFTKIEGCSPSDYLHNAKNTEAEKYFSS